MSYHYNLQNARKMLTLAQDYLEAMKGGELLKAHNAIVLLEKYVDVEHQNLMYHVERKLNNG